MSWVFTHPSTGTLSASQVDRALAFLSSISQGSKLGSWEAVKQFAGSCMSAAAAACAPVEFWRRDAVSSYLNDTRAYLHERRLLWLLGCGQSSDDQKPALPQLDGVIQVLWLL